jgi:hypothetical protein
MQAIETPTVTLVDTLAGVFTFCHPDGSLDTAQFFVRCEPRPSLDDPDFNEIMDRRNDALNQQFTDAWTNLQAAGCSNIQYKESIPDPFF